MPGDGARPAVPPVGGEPRGGGMFLRGGGRGGGFFFVFFFFVLLVLIFVLYKTSLPHWATPVQPFSIFG